MQMRLPAVTLAPVLIAAAGLAGSAQVQRPWPPPVQQVPADAPPLSPEAALRTFSMPPGYRLELVASEPMVEDPIWLDIDPDGRFWVVEMQGFMPTAEERNTTRAPVCRVVVLEDDDDDGTMDRRTVFLDKLVLPRSLKVLDRGVLVAEPPNLWLARDTDGDLVADTKELVRDDYGRLMANPEHNANGLLWGLDNWIYTSEHDGHFRVRKGQLEHHKTVSRGQWGLTMDDVGRIYRNWNEQPAFVDLVPGRYYARNPNLVRTRGSYEMLMEPRDMLVWPIRPTRGVNRGYREGTLRPDGTLTTYVSAGTPTVYRGDRLPAELHGNLFVTEPAGNLVHRLILDEAGGELRARNAYKRGEFLASTDERFRPVNLYSAPDGTLYVVDMYRGIVQEGAYQTHYLRNYIKSHKLDVPLGLGRIYRVMHRSTTRAPKPRLSAAPPAKLVELLAHPNGWWRDTAQRLLVERGAAGVVPALKDLALDAPDHRTRLHALWTLEGLDAIEPATVERALADASPHVRASAVRIAERWLAEPGHPIRPLVLARLEDTEAVVRRQLAASLGELPEGERADTLTKVLERVGGDPVAVDAALSGLHGSEAAVLERTLAAAAPGGGRDDVVMVLAGAVVRSNRSEDVRNVLAWAGEPERREWQRLALLRGLDAGLPGGQLLPRPGGAPPGTASRAAGGAAGGSGRGVGRGAGAPMLTLAAEPAGLVALAGGTGPLGELAERVVSRLDWPGKPKPPAADGAAAAADARPLTPEEEKRFAAGKEVYGNLCAACHQPDGRGLPALAPSLLGSRWAVGAPDVAIRIVLNGKEGQQMMPPLQSLTDDQIAAALTFVRRSWGHAASAVEPALVGRVRRTTAQRTQPWTEEELARLPAGSGAGQGGR